MSASKLLLFNGALTMCGERTLASLTEEREPRRLLDVAWDGGAVDYCLERGQWTFATRTIKLEYSPSVEPPFGYPRAFDKPVDFIRTAALCQDEFFKVPLLEYSDEADFWFANLDVIYVKYVSNDNLYGNDMGKWPPSFSEFVESYLAAKIVTKVTQDNERVRKVEGAFEKLMKEAKSLDAMAKPTAFPPMGSWARTRIGRGGGDGGNRNNLIG